MSGRGRGERRRGQDRRRPQRGSRDSESERPHHGHHNKQIVIAKSERATEREKQEQQKQLDNEFPALVKAEGGGQPDEMPAGAVKLKQREDKRSESPALHKPLGKKESFTERPLTKLKTAVRLVDDNHIFSQAILDYLTDNTDFIVIGVLGMQNAGKSTILNCLAKLDFKDDEDIFRVQNYEHQMLAEHCTNGIDVYINGRRIILLDCQPLLSASLMDRTIQLDRKQSGEFNSTENTLEVHSLQVMGFMFSVCHTVLLVQDWFTDPNLLRLVGAAEMLKPLTPTANEDQQIHEYFPHLVVVQNKCSQTEMEEEQREEMETFYSRVLSKSRLRWQADTEETKPLLFLIPDFEDEKDEPAITKILARSSYDECVGELRRTVLSLRRSPLTHARLTERSWLNLANRTWDNIKNSGFYMEYSRLLP